MTVCIGILCCNKEAVVAVSDKMVTAGDIEFEHSEPKIEKLTNRCVALTAGSALAHVELFDKVRGLLGSADDTAISDIVEIIKREYVALRKQKIEEEILKPRGLTLSAFIEHMNDFPVGFSSNIDQYIDKREYNVTAIVCGIDNEGAHLYRIIDPGTEDRFDAIGFVAIGIGRKHAEGSLIRNKCFQSTPLNRAVYYAVEAKINAEVAPGVGSETDATIIDENGSTELSEGQISELRKMYEDKVKPVKLEGLLKKVDQLQLQGTPPTNCNKEGV